MRGVCSPAAAAAQPPRPARLRCARLRRAAPGSSAASDRPARERIEPRRLSQFDEEGWNSYLANRISWSLSSVLDAIEVAIGGLRKVAATQDRNRHAGVTVKGLAEAISSAMPRLDATEQQIVELIASANPFTVTPARR